MEVRLSVNIIYSVVRFGVRFLLFIVKVSVKEVYNFLVALEVILLEYGA